MATAGNTSLAAGTAMATAAPTGAVLVLAAAVVGDSPARAL